MFFCSIQSKLKLKVVGIRNLIERTIAKGKLLKVALSKGIQITSNLSESEIVHIDISTISKAKISKI